MLVSYSSWHEIYPQYFPAPRYALSDETLNTAKVQLGRALFYDPILSRDSTISCASCHSPYLAFAHSDHDLSHGIDDLIGERNAPALFNLAWHEQYMWDGAIQHLDAQALAPISHPREMDEDLSHVIKKLSQKALYPKLFYTAYGDSIISGKKFLDAISSFLLTLISVDSKYDSVQNGLAQFSAQEQRGYALFIKNCNSCHQQPLFTTTALAYNGLPMDSVLQDFGRWDITLQKGDSFLFKIPSLRNLSYTAPYMHDGRFRTLRQVLGHYAQRFDDDPRAGLGLHQIEVLDDIQQADLIAFLLTLDDAHFVRDTSHQFPRSLLLGGG